MDVALLTLDAGELDTTAWPEAARHVLAGDFAAVLAAGLPGLPGDFSELAWHQALLAALPAYVAAEPASRAPAVLCLGAAALHLFWQVNATGPAVETIPGPSPSDAWDAWALEALGSDGEVPVQTLTAPGLLAVARAALTDACIAPTGPLAAAWTLRALLTHQRVLETNAATLHAAIAAAVEAVLALVAAAPPLPLHAQLQLEVAAAHVHHGHGRAAAEQAAAACTTLGLTLQLEGALGVRTKFQVDARAQLFLRATPTAAAAAAVLAGAGPTPPQAVLDDDTVLPEGVRFETAQEHAPLAPLAQAALLASAAALQKSRAADELMGLELGVYAARALVHATHWAPTFAALLLRCHVERKLPRHAPRALQQLELLVAQYADAAPGVVARHRFFFCFGQPLRAELELSLGELYLFLGVPRDAQPLFERWRSYENLIHCFRLTEQHVRAEELVRQRLAAHATPTLLCVLGDLTDDPAHYEAAWALSGERSARAQRALGQWHLRKAERASALALDGREHYVACAAALDRSLALNCIQDALWFSLGCCHLRLGDYPAAAHAFRRKTELDGDNFEAWANLASAYLRMGAADKALVALREAAKGGFDNWRVWANTVVAALAVRSFREAMAAVQRMLELGRPFDDADAVAALGDAVVLAVPDVAGNPASALQPHMDELAAKLKSVGHLTPPTWLALSRYHAGTGHRDQAAWCARTAFTEARAQPQWERDDVRAALVADALAALVQPPLDAGDAPALKPLRLLLKPTLQTLARAAELGVACARAAEHAARLEALLARVQAVVDAAAAAAE